MKKEKFLNWLFILSVIVLGLNFASCSEDDDNFNGNDTPPVVDVPNPAGDDFYMFVNGEWHENLTDTEELQGYIQDVENMLDEKTDEIFEEMEEYQIVQMSLQKMEEDNNNLNLIRMLEITHSILSEIETEEDAYVAIGKCISMGLMEESLKVYMACEGSDILYTFGPRLIEQDAGSNVFSHKKVRKYKRYTPKTRAEGDIMSAILEGVNMDPDCFVYEGDFLDETLENLSAKSLDELKEYIKENIYSELSPYCGDEFICEISQGVIPTTADYLDLMREELFTYSIAYGFNEAFVSDETKEQFKVYAEELRAAFAKRIEDNTWLSGQTKQAALDKLEKMLFFFGGPDEWQEEGFPEPQGELLVDDILEVKASRIRLIESMLNKSIFEESMSYIMFMLDGAGLNENNAGYMIENNSVNILPVFMMEPEWEENMDPSEMYALFYVIAHEITHGFDKDGAKYNAYGEEEDWWTADDKEKFLALNDKLSTQISTMEAAPGILANGKLTITEDVADLGGLNIAFDALNEYLKNKGVTGEELVNAQKRFFEKYAARYCMHYTAEELADQLKDEHSVSKIRVNGMLQHMDAWYELYNVVEGDSLYLPVEERVVIW